MKEDQVKWLGEEMRLEIQKSHKLVNDLRQFNRYQEGFVLAACFLWGVLGILIHSAIIEGAL
jgi:hypothetical protein